MNTDWFELNVAAVASVAELTLCLAILSYLLSLPNKDREAKLFTGIFFLLCLFYADDVFYNFVIYMPFRRVIIVVGNIILCFSNLLFVWFAYQCGGNPFRRESTWALLVLSLILALTLLLSDIGTRNIYLALAFSLCVAWVVGIYTRKARRVEQELGRPTPTSKMLRGFQKWAIIDFLIWTTALYFHVARLLEYLPFTLWYYVAHSLGFIQITYSTIVFLNYTQQRTSFQAKVVGLVLCPLLIILALTPFLLRQLIVDLPNFGSVNHRMSAAFLWLIPITTLTVLAGLPRLLRSNLLNPLNQILDGVRQVDAGNLGVQVPVLVNDEVGLLAQQFNRMTNSLQRYSSEMETLVAERTAQLQQTLDTLKATQAQLIQKEKMASLGELTAGIAHEIQNPLNFVNNFSDVSVELVEELKEEAQAGRTTHVLALADDLSQNLQHITQNGQRASNIVRGMLEHSRTPSSERRPTNLNALADEYLKLAYHGMRVQDPDFSVQLCTQFDDDSTSVVVSPQDIGRVLLNLYNNAFYAVRQKQQQQVTGFEPQVMVSTQVDQGTIVLLVKDNGTGIPKNIMDKIYQPFFTTKPTGQGTGLGLSLSYDIVTKAHGGDMRVVSHEGEGTEFVIQLPLF
ncbi:sensor histidine kinase [Spirosoma fluviale]|uniref:histidine kinase n=1 Tax=Spirosoma fluviale TaxID=1597977 RepID=A0A286G9E3_9BACT|nr:ATP-binding protein [Spirosoma fluviale]SOD92118.1 His Kinase A (phospho-acceptor) domain-containing protein [Spirosoma fluviale]